VSPIEGHLSREKSIPPVREVSSSPLVDGVGVYPIRKGVIMGLDLKIEIRCHPFKRKMRRNGGRGDKEMRCPGTRGCN